MLRIDWPNLLAGFILGFVPAMLGRASVLYKTLRDPARNKFIGHFWRYHRTTRGTGEIIEGAVDVKRSIITGRLSVRLAQVSNKEVTRRLRYTGSLSARAGMVRYMLLKDSGSHERSFSIFIDPFHDPFGLTVGVETCLDLRGLPVAVPIVFSQQQLTLDEAGKLLPTHVINTESPPF